MLNDLRFAARLFRRQSVTMALAVIGLALAIGVNTAAFSFVSTFSLQPIGVPEPDAVVHVLQTTSSRPEYMWPYSRYLQLRSQVSLMRIEAWYGEGARFTDATGLNESVQIRFVSGGFVETLRGRPALGRVLQPDDDVTGAQPVTVVSYAFWKTRLGSDPAAVGRSAYISGTPVTVVGVLERGFTGPFPIDQAPAIWMTLGAANAVYDYLGPFDASSARLVRLVARSSSVAGMHAARAEASAAAMAMPPLTATAQAPQATGVLLEPVANPASSSRQLVSAFIMAIVGLVLLLGCANVANLLLAGATSRQQEIATRLSLGASRGRIIRQLLTESTLVGLVAGALGLLVALLLLPVVSALVQLPPSIEVTPDWRVYVFAVLASLVAGIIAGLAPARHGARGDVLSPLKGGGAPDRAWRPSRVRAVFLGIQAAASIVLIVLAALFSRAALHGTTQDLGFEPARFVSVSIVMPKATPPARVADLKQRAIERAGTLPGVEDVALAEFPPFNGGSRPTSVQRDGRRFRYLQNRTSASYFETMGAHVVRGRTFTAAEVANHAPVVVVSERVANDLWGSGDPMGRTIDGVATSKGDPIDLSHMHIIGVVEDQLWADLDRAQTGTIYVPLPAGNASELIVRTTGDALDSAKPIQESLSALDPSARVKVYVIQNGLDRELRPAIMMAQMASALGMLALTLAVIGMFGVTALLVSQRLLEISIRIAIGATREDILRLLVRESLRPVAIGLAAGLALVLGGGQVLASMLYGVSPRDPVAFGFAAVLLVGATLTAVVIPAHRAARVDPARVLRQG